MTSTIGKTILTVEEIIGIDKSKALFVEDPTPECEAIQKEIGLCEYFIITQAYLSTRTPVSNYRHQSYNNTAAQNITGKEPLVFGIKNPDNYNNKNEITKCKNAKVVNVRIFKNNIVSEKASKKLGYNFTPFGSLVDYYNRDRDNSFWVALVTIDFHGTHVPLFCELHYINRLFGISYEENFDITIDGEVVGNLKSNNDAPNHLAWDNILNGYNFTLASASIIVNKLNITNAQIAKNILLGMAKIYPEKIVEPAGNRDGISKVFKKVSPIVQGTYTKDPFGYLAFYALADDTKGTRDGVKGSSVFNAIYGDVENEEDFLRVNKSVSDLISLYQPKGWSGEPRPWHLVSQTYEIIKDHAAYKENRKKALKANGNRAFNKLMQDFDSIKISEKEFPKTTKLIKSGEIPLTTFFRKSEQYFLLNDNWALWEEMLKKGHEEFVIEISNEACKRTTYEKDIMSYFYFILHALPEYLKKHTGKKWTCIPKLVDSATELEPPSDDGSGIRRSRSALTPIVDNEANTVTVPYASLRIPGQQTTYCYSLNYGILSKGFSWVGNACHVDIEEKLNGRDDYGLMFYTLTGSAQGRGYPTFLIIFERRKSGTHVHFHRTHPSRSKDGDYNPVHNWIKVCYNWMVGNVNKDLIRYQQGDLVFTAMTEEEAKDLVFAEKVERYDNHGFSKPVEFAQYTKKEKSNILGYARINEPTVLEHHEHEHVPMEPGTYSIRQCRSWEASPVGIWSLRID